MVFTGGSLLALSYAVAISSRLVDAQAARVVPQNFDPLAQFCHRFNHQTAVVDNRLYIDGGYLQISPLNPNGPMDFSNYSNPDILYHDLTTTIRNGTNIEMPPLITSLKPKPANVPLVAGGTFWADETNKKLYLYGGRFTSAQPVPFDLWMYDTLYDTWEEVNATTAATRNGNGDGFKVARIYNGASAVVERLGLGYYLGGWIGPESEYGYEGPDVVVSNLLVYDMVRNIWRNETVPNGDARAEGVMLYAPLSDNGLLIAFGGVRATPNVDDGGNRADGLNITGIPMSEISIYDINQGRWYTQTATGDIPAPRRLFCAGLASGNAVGKNGVVYPTHNIYLYGGAATGEGAGFDNVYVLSLPTFTWTRFWPANDVNNNPHHSLSCNVISNSQMLIIGGYFPNANSGCDTPGQSGVHNLNLSGSDPEGTIWRAFSVNSTDYSVPVAIVDSLGLNESSPVVTYDHPDLPTLLARTPSAATRTPTRDVTVSSAAAAAPGLSTHDKNIIIAVVTCVGVLLIGFCIFIYIFVRRRRHHPVSTVDDDAPTPPVMPSAIVNEHDLYVGDANSVNIPPDMMEPGFKYGGAGTAASISEFSMTTNGHNGATNGAPTSPPAPAFSSPRLDPPTSFPPPPPPPPPPVVPAEQPLAGPPVPIAYIRNPATGGLTPVYDEVGAAAAGSGLAAPGRVVAARTLSYSESIDEYSTQPASEVHADSIAPQRTNEGHTVREQSGLHELPGGN